MSENLLKVIESKLLALDPDEVQVIDETPRHYGHLNYKVSGEISHIKIRVRARKLDGMTALEQHRYVLNLIREEVKKIHAVSLDT